jgi:hypothetical protein
MDYPFNKIEFFKSYEKLSKKLFEKNVLVYFVR